MSDRSEELAESREPRSTDELLEETERLLSEPSDDSPAAPSEASPEQPPTDAAAADEAATSDSRSSRLPSRLSLGQYFSPKGFLALALLVGAGLFAGATALPFGGAGRILGMFAVSFTLGLATSKRRYLEMGAAGVSVGAATALLTSPMLVAAGSSQTVLAVGASTGLAAVLGGYYFGRDLRDGLFRDVE